MEQPGSPADPELDRSLRRPLELLRRLLEALPDTRAVLEALMDIAIEGLRVERGAMLFFDELGAEGYPQELVRGFEQGQLDNMRAKLSTSALEEMKRSGTLLVVPDVSADRRFRDARSVTRAGILSLLVAPVRVSGRLVGAIYLDVRRGRRSFDAEDRRLVEALVALAGTALERADQIGSLSRENVSLRQDAGRFGFGGLIGASQAMQTLFRELEKVCARPDAVTVLLEGDNGTGKSRIARLLHDHSNRARKPFVTFSCGAVPENLVESDLFGHERGAFTGAVARKPGLLEQADGGSIFFDDVNLLSAPIQAKLLHFLQERELRPVGSTRPRKVDVRVICSSNQPLKRLVSERLFREDLYYRLNFVALRVPSLSERGEDVPLLARHFLEQALANSGRKLEGFTPEALALMMSHGWPGNVRELESEIAHAVTMAEGPYIGIDAFKSGGLRAAGGGETQPRSFEGDEPLQLDRAVEQLSRHVLGQALERCEGNVTRAAKLVGVSRGRFYDLAHKYDVDLGSD